MGEVRTFFWRACCLSAICIHW